MRITHPERVVFPGTTITKGDVAAYYATIMDWLLPEIEGRPLSIIRCPDGAGAGCFFQKHHADKLGAHVASILLKEKGGGSDRYLYVDDPRGVLELVQMNTLEFHPWGSRVDDPERPDRLVFDLDPAPGVGWSALVAAAKDVRARVRAHGLESFPRLSGGKGVHVVVPIRRGPLWDQAKAFCETIADEMAAEDPKHYLATREQGRARRPHLHRLAAQRARRDQRRELVAARARRCACRDAAALGRSCAPEKPDDIRSRCGAEAREDAAQTSVG